MMEKPTMKMNEKDIFREIKLSEIAASEGWMPTATESTFIKYNILVPEKGFVHGIDRKTLDQITGLGYDYRINIAEIPYITFYKE